MESAHNLVEFGSGYGTFTIASAALVTVTVFAFDIEPGMLKAAAIRTKNLGLTNIKYVERDVIADGTGLALYRGDGHASGGWPGGPRKGLLSARTGIDGSPAMGARFH